MRERGGFVVWVGVIGLVGILAGSYFYFINSSNSKLESSITKKSINVTDNSGKEDGVRVEVVEGDLVVVRDGKNMRITSWGRNSKPVLSPDKTKVAYISVTKETVENERNSQQGYVQSSDNIWVMGIDGLGEMQLTKHDPFVYRGNLLWLDDNRLLFTDGASSVRVYDLKLKQSQTVLGPIKAEAACLDACGFESKFLGNNDASYLVWIESTAMDKSIIRILDVKTLKAREVEGVGIEFGSVRFEENGRVLVFKTSTGSKIKYLDLESGKIRY